MAGEDGREREARTGRRRALREEGWEWRQRGSLYGWRRDSELTQVRRGWKGASGGRSAVEGGGRWAGPGSGGESSRPSAVEGVAA